MEFIVVFGGESWEHEISIVSAITLKKELKNIAHFIFIDAENDLYLIPRESMKSTHFSSLAYKKDAKVAFTKGGFLQNGFLKKQILRGVVINLIHGKSGEDGQIAGILDFYQIPFIGPRIEACAVSFSKELTKSYAESVGVRVLDYFVVDSAKSQNLGENSDKIAESALDFAKSQNLVKKPCHSNSFSCHSEQSEESKKNPSLRANPQDLRGNPPCENTQNLQSRLPRSHSLARNDDSILDSAPSTQEVNSTIADEFLGFCEASDKDRTKVHRGSEPKRALRKQLAHTCKSLKSRCESEFAFPCIIKPSHLGSSLGIAVAKSKDDLPYALDCAFEYDNRVVIEPFIPHIREFNLAGCKINGEFIFSIIEEVKKNEFFAFEDKYLDFQGGEKKKEANLSDEVAQKIKENFKAIYENCFEGALIRCDFFLQSVNGVDEIYLNEINPIPGSLAHYLFDDFNAVLQNLAQNLPQKRKIQVKYQYISKIQAQKGK